MPKSAFAHVTTWVFDLDNTLYPPQARLFDQIEVRMTRFVMEALDVNHTRADFLRKDYWRRYGTTLAGLMQEHGVDPGPYLTDVHEIDLSHLVSDPDLRDRIAALPGRKIVYTNGCAPYAERVIEKRGLAGLFDAVYGVEHADFHPKPHPLAFDTIFGLDGLAPDRAAMFEDDARNLLVPHELGLRTVHVAPEPDAGDHIHHHTDDLSDFLEKLV